MAQSNHQAIEDINYWQHHVSQFQEVKQTKMRYCRQHEVNYHRFLYWFAKLTKSNDAELEAVEMIPVHIVDSQSKKPGDPVASITVKSGMIIHLYDENVLCKLIQALGT